MLTGLFGPEKADVTGEWGKLCNEELNNVCPSVNIVRAMKEDALN
jgi:hypothetical protein